MLAVDRQTAMRWLANVERSNERFVYEMRKDPAIDVREFAGRVALNFLLALRDLGEDEHERSLLVEYGAHGINNAVLQTMLHTPPPALFERKPNA